LLLPGVALDFFWQVSPFPWFSLPPFFFVKLLFTNLWCFFRYRPLFPHFVTRSSLLRRRHPGLWDTMNHGLEDCRFLPICPPFVDPYLRPPLFFHYTSLSLPRFFAYPVEPLRPPEADLVWNSRGANSPEDQRVPPLLPFPVEVFFLTRLTVAGFTVPPFFPRPAFGFFFFFLLGLFFYCAFKINAVFYSFPFPRDLVPNPPPQFLNKSNLSEFWSPPP